METYVIKLFEQMLDSSIVRSLLIIILIVGGGFAFRAVMAYLKKILNETTYMKAYQYASDKACEHALGNGYGKKRDEELKKALERENFIQSK